MEKRLAKVQHCDCFLRLMNYKKNSDDWHASLSIPLNLPKALLRQRDKVLVVWSLVQKHEVGALIACEESLESVFSGEIRLNWRNPHLKTGTRQPKVVGNMPPLDLLGRDSGIDKVLIVVG